ncbi:hypothetical protein N9L47_10795 [Rhodobacteraceae bacterium]|nr:hypothetical protein [Paracoccaceae bacterium]
MSAEGEKHAAELAKLEQRRKELEDALQRLARDEAEAEEVAELAQEVERLEQLIETARAAANTEKTMTHNDVKKAARTNREAAEKALDDMANSMQAEGETFEKAYGRAMDTDMGIQLIKARDDAQELERDGITSMEVADAHKFLNA